MLRKGFRACCCESDMKLRTFETMSTVDSFDIPKFKFYTS